jgi:hypothetical protein
MGVDEAGDDRLPLEIDALHSSRRKVEDVVVRADGKDAVSGDGHRLGAGLHIVNRDDVGVV